MGAGRLLGPRCGRPHDPGFQLGAGREGRQDRQEQEQAGTGCAGGRARRGVGRAEGTKIGKSNGRVTQIDDNLVVVQETYVDSSGETTTKDIEMRIRATEGG